MFYYIVPGGQSVGSPGSRAPGAVCYVAAAPSPIMIR